MNVSKFLSKVLGLYLLIASIAMLSNMAQFTGYVNLLVNNTPLMFVMGFITLIIGILLVVSHNIWEWGWRVIITIIAWIFLLKGISILFFPQFIDQLSLLFVQNAAFSYISGCIDLGAVDNSHW